MVDISNPDQVAMTDASTRTATKREGYKCHTLICAYNGRMRSMSDTNIKKAQTTMKAIGINPSLKIRHRRAPAAGEPRAINRIIDNDTTNNGYTHVHTHNDEEEQSRANIAIIHSSSNNNNNRTIHNHTHDGDADVADTDLMVEGYGYYYFLCCFPIIPSTRLLPMWQLENELDVEEQEILNEQLLFHMRLALFPTVSPMSPPTSPSLPSPVSAPSPASLGRRTSTVSPTAGGATDVHNFSAIV